MRGNNKKKDRADFNFQRQMRVIDTVAQSAMFSVESMLKERGCVYNIVGKKRQKTRRKVSVVRLWSREYE